MESNDCRSKYIGERVSSGELNKSSAQELHRTFKRIGYVEEKLGKQIENYLTREDFVLLFENLRITKVYSFKNARSVIRSYFEWLKASGLANPNISALDSVKYSELSLRNAFDQKYFKDFRSLQDKIDATLKAADKVDNMVFATQIAAIYLAWCGVKVANAVTIKKSDVTESSISVGGQKIYPNAVIMDFLKNYRAATGFEAQAKQVINLKYMSSEYLLRTTKKEQLSPKLLSFLLASFSKSAVDQEEQFSNDTFAYDKIYWSGVFHRAYLCECENGTIGKNDVETINRVFGESYDTTAKANLRLSDYKAFREYFFPQG